jgi:serpin B
MIHLVTPLIVFILGAAYTGIPMDDLVRGNNRFAVELLGQVRDQPGNLFFSPSSISTALAMTYAGARHETARQMAETLHFTLPPDRLHPAFASLIRSLESGASEGGYRLSVANRLWGPKGYHYRPDFLSITRDQYGAELAEVDFAASEQARQTINAWISEKTEGKILDLIPSGVLDALTRLVLTNAIYFKGTWSEPFPKALTQEAPFHLTRDETTKAPLMQRQGDLRFWAGEGLKVVELPYAGGTLAMTVLLPDAIDGLPALEAGLTDEKLGRWLSGLRSRKVAVALPRFKMTSEFSLGQTLAKMGMPLAFDRNRADFSGITSVEPLYIAAVIHKAFVDVNEEGTEAAAATGVVMKTRAAMVPQPIAVFRADHPFLFLIRDLKSGSILFLGRVVNPNG